MKGVVSTDTFKELSQHDNGKDGYPQQGEGNLWSLKVCRRNVSLKADFRDAFSVDLSSKTTCTTCLPMMHALFWPANSCLVSSMQYAMALFVFGARGDNHTANSLRYDAMYTVFYVQCMPFVRRPVDRRTAQARSRTSNMQWKYLCNNESVRSELDIIPLTPKEYVGRAAARG
jgi:hypothetical protein